MLCLAGTSGFCSTFYGLYRMSSTTKSALISSLYDAFAIGDVPTVVGFLGHLQSWEVMGEGAISYAGTYDASNITEFFMKLGQSLQVTDFRVDKMWEDADSVVAKGYLSGTSTATGKHAGGNWIMLWEFENGNIVRFADYYDTYTFHAVEL